MFVFSTGCTESTVSYDQDIWKYSHESSDSCVNETTGLCVPYDSSTYSTARSLSECYEDRCPSLSHNVCPLSDAVQANANSTSVCLSSMSSHSLMQSQAHALHAAGQSSLTLQCLCEPRTVHIVSDPRVSEIHTTLPSSTVTVCCYSVDSL